MAKVSKGAKKGKINLSNNMVSKKAAKKAVAKKTVKKAAKKAVPKKAAKSAMPKKAVKKAAARKAAPAKKTAKPAPKKAIKKAAPKKAAPKKAAPRAVKKSAPKKAMPLKKPGQQQPDETPVTTDEVVGKAANLDGSDSDNQGSGEAPVGDQGNRPIVKVEDPITAADQKAYQKVLTKHDPRHNMQLSSNSKGGIKPSGKKPLWRK